LLLSDSAAILASHRGRESDLLLLLRPPPLSPPPLLPLPLLILPLLMLLVLLVMFSPGTVVSVAAAAVVVCRRCC